jgi:hypothetical protein
MVYTYRTTLEQNISMSEFTYFSLQKMYQQYVQWLCVLEVFIWYTLHS